MAKLSDNQVAGVKALADLLADTGVAVADKNAWKKAAPDGVSININSLVKAGAITVTRAHVGSRVLELYAPVRAEAEIGG